MAMDTGILTYLRADAPVGIYMLKKSKKNKDEKRFVASGEVGKKSTHLISSPISGDMRTIIGEHMSIEGSICGEETLKVEGSVTGNIQLGRRDLTIGSRGRVRGEIRARNVSIRGELKGNVKALDRVEVKREADFHGEIKAKRISVEDGAYFKGIFELDREDRSMSPDSEKPEEYSAPSAGIEKTAR